MQVSDASEQHGYPDGASLEDFTPVFMIGQPPCGSPKQTNPEAPLSVWESQREHFSLESLNALASEYNALPVDANGNRRIGSRDLEAISRKVLKLPAPVITDMLQLRGLPSGATGSGKAELAGEGVLVLRTLLDLLDFLHSATAHMVKHRVELLWNVNELEDMKVVFRSYANGQAFIRIANLFSLISDIGTDCFDFDRTEHQKFVVDIVRRTQAKSISGTTTPKNGGVLNFSQVLDILAVSVHEKRIAARSEELLNEQTARHQGKFSVAEIEDLRLLHSVFLAQGIDSGDNENSKERIVSRLASMLQSCGVKSLSDPDLRLLRSLIPEKLSRDDEVSFGKFVTWMEGVFSNRLGGLERKSNHASGPSDNSFAATLLRECPDAKKPPSDEKATGTIRETSASSGGETASSSVAPSQTRRTQRRKTIARQSTWTSSRAEGAQTSRSNSRSQSKRASTKEKCTPNDAPDAPEVFNLKGLPPSEAMLARREMRACSVDFDDPTAVHQVPGAVRDHLANFKLEQSQPLERKVKPVTDSHVVVSGAIERLVATSHTMASDSGVEDAES
jgi:hypothetical protein